MPTPSDSILQAAALPLRDDQICLVQSRSGKRWLLPKGKLERGQSHQEAAILEAWQEAGVLGMLDPEPVGSYRYWKRGRWHEVVVFMLHVTHVANTWPEQSWRPRHWLPTDEAIEQVSDAALRRLIESGLQRPRHAVSA